MTRSLALLALAALLGCKSAKAPPDAGAPAPAAPAAPVDAGPIDPESLAAIDRALALRARGDSAAASEVMEKAVRWARVRGDRPGEAWALHRAGDLMLDLHRCDDARTRYLAAKKLHEELGDRVKHGLVANDLGLWARECDPEQQPVWFGLAVRLREGDPKALALSANNLGSAEMCLLHVDEAQRAFETALKAAEQSSDFSMQRKVLANLSLLWVLEAEPGSHERDAEDEPGPVKEGPELQRARDYFQRAVDAAKRAGEDPIDVCAAFGTYENRCDRVMPKSP